MTLLPHLLCSKVFALATSPAWNVAGWTMIHFFWIGLAIAALGGVLRLACRHAQPAVGYLISLTTLVLLAITPAAVPWRQCQNVCAYLSASVLTMPQFARLRPYASGGHALPRDGALDAIYEVERGGKRGGEGVGEGVGERRSALLAKPQAYAKLLVSLASSRQSISGDYAG